MRSSSPSDERTRIYRFAEQAESLVGFVAPGGDIFRLPGTVLSPIGFAGSPLGAEAIGRVDPSGRVFRYTTHGASEVGAVSEAGAVRSHGLFQGGDLGWVDAHNVVVQAGLIFGEEEVGRVEGPHPEWAAAALLLLFMPDEQEAARRQEGK